MANCFRPTLLRSLALVLAVACGSSWLWSAEDKPSDTKAAPEKTDAAKAAEKAAGTTNPYVPRKGMSVEDLKAYIERMQEAPASIRNRPGFAEGMAMASQRILDTDPKDSLRAFAVLSLLDSLHQWADLEESREADSRLGELATKYADDADKKIAAAAAFFAFEQRVLKADQVDAAKLPALLDEIKRTLQGKQLDAKHLRLASATVGLINRLKDDPEATRRMKEFGDLFAASGEPLLARYGRKLAQTGAPEEGKESDWVGKPIELTGITAEGAKFDFAQYKGKVVLVDFWATWCGPCRAALPELKATYEKYHAKGLEVIGIDLDRELSELTDFLNKEKLPWVNIVGEEKDGQLQFPMAEKYGIRAIPTTMLVGRDGKIVSQIIGAQDLTKQIEKLLAQAKDAAKGDLAKPEAAATPETDKPAATK